MRLIDADKLKDLVNLTYDGLRNHPLFDEKGSMLRAAFSTLIKMIDDAPTVCELGADLEDRKEEDE